MLPLNDGDHNAGAPPADEEGAAEAVAATAPRAPADPAAARRQTNQGYAFCIACGFINGTLMVPSMLFMQDVEVAAASGAYPDGLPSGLSFLPSFGIGIMIVVLPLHAMYYLARRTRPRFLPRTSALPGMATGVLWAIGNACAIIAGATLGSAIGYPLTQTALLVAQIWSVAYFKEIRGFAIVILVVFAFVLLAGAAMLAFFG